MLALCNRAVRILPLEGVRKGANRRHLSLRPRRVRTPMSAHNAPTAAAKVTRTGGLIVKEQHSAAEVGEEAHLPGRIQVAMRGVLARRDSERRVRGEHPTREDPSKGLIVLGLLTLAVQLVSVAPTTAVSAHAVFHPMVTAEKGNLVSVLDFRRLGLDSEVHHMTAVRLGPDSERRHQAAVHLGLVLPLLAQAVAPRVSAHFQAAAVDMAAVVALADLRNLGMVVTCQTPVVSAVVALAFLRKLGLVVTCQTPAVETQAVSVAAEVSEVLALRAGPTPSVAHRLKVAAPMPTVGHRLQVAAMASEVPTPSVGPCLMVAAPTPSVAPRLKVAAPTPSVDHRLKVVAPTLSVGRSIPVVAPTPSVGRRLKQVVATTILSAAAVSVLALVRVSVPLPMLSAVGVLLDGNQIRAGCFSILLCCRLRSNGEIERNPGVIFTRLRNYLGV